MRLSTKVWLAVLVLVAGEAVSAERQSVSVLSRPVNHFSIGETSALNALLWFGRDQQLCFGIEFSGRDLSRKVRVTAEKTTVGEIVLRILGSSNALQLSAPEGVILIRKKGVKPPAWLDHRLPQLEMPRLDLMSANSLLWMSLERDLNPSLQGFAGDHPVTRPIDEVGPFRARRQSVRQLLIRIVASSRGASWFPTAYGAESPFPASINRRWTLVTYSGSTAPRPK